MLVFRGYSSDELAFFFIAGALLWWQDLTRRGVAVPQAVAAGAGAVAAEGALDNARAARMLRASSCSRVRRVKQQGRGGGEKGEFSAAAVGREEKGGREKEEGGGTLCRHMLLRDLSLLHAGGGGNGANQRAGERGQMLELIGLLGKKQLLPVAFFCFSKKR